MYNSLEIPYYLSDARAYTIGEVLADLEKRGLVAEHIVFLSKQESSTRGEILEQAIEGGKNAQEETAVIFTINEQHLPDWSLQDILVELVLLVHFHSLKIPDSQYGKLAVENFQLLLDGVGKNPDFERESDSYERRIQDELRVTTRFPDLTQQLIKEVFTYLKAHYASQTLSRGFLNEYLRSDASVQTLLDFIESTQLLDLFTSYIRENIIEHFAEKKRRFVFLDVFKEEESKLKTPFKKEYIHTKSRIISLFARAEIATKSDHTSLLYLYLNDLFEKTYIPDLMARHNVDLERDFDQRFRDRLHRDVLRRKNNPISKRQLIEITQNYFREVSPREIRIIQKGRFKLIISLPAPERKSDAAVRKIISYFFIPLAVKLEIEYRKSTGHFLILDHLTESKIGHFRLG